MEYGLDCCNSVQKVQYLSDLHTCVYQLARACHGAKLELVPRAQSLTPGLALRYKVAANFPP